MKEKVKVFLRPITTIADLEETISIADSPITQQSPYYRPVRSISIVNLENKLKKSPTFIDSKEEDYYV